MKTLPKTLVAAVLGLTAMGANASVDCYDNVCSGTENTTTFSYDFNNDEVGMYIEFNEPLKYDGLKRETLKDDFIHTEKIDELIEVTINGNTVGYYNFTYFVNENFASIDHADVALKMVNIFNTTNITVKVNDVEYNVKPLVLADVKLITQLMN